MTVVKSQTIRPFRYAGLHGREAWCDLAVYELGDGRRVCIATERADNPGASITNTAELAATAAARELGIPPETLVWVEHYAGSESYASDDPRFHRHTYDRVEFTIERIPRADLPPTRRWRFAEPTWRRMTAEDWNDLGIRPQGV